MIKEVIVVEGRQDVAAVRRAVAADVIATGGFALSPATLGQIKKACDSRGIIILTDPDGAGERIRRTLAARFPTARHAFVPRTAAEKNGDVGVENAAPAAIVAALQAARCGYWQGRREFTRDDLRRAGLDGTAQAARRRAGVGARLGIGYGNARQFLHRLNAYGVTREEFAAAVTAEEEAAHAASADRQA